MFEVTLSVFFGIYVGISTKNVILHFHIQHSRELLLLNYTNVYQILTVAFIFIYITTMIAILNGLMGLQDAVK